MAVSFQGKRRIRVTQKNASFDQRFRITGATSGNGTYPGVVGAQAVVDGPNWSITLEWNNNAGSGWQESAVSVGVGSISPLVLISILGADDNFPDQRDGDFDDLIVFVEDLDPIFTVTQRPFSLDRGTLAMLPDGIFDTSQSIQYMGVAVRNEWEFDWNPGIGVMIGISNTSRAALASQGIQVIDAWSTQEQQALQQEVSGGFVKVPDLRMGQTRMVYFKVDVRNAAPGKPVVSFVAQRSPAWDPAYDQPTRQVDRKIFISRSSYDPSSRELVAEIPEGTIFLRLNHILVEPRGLTRALREALRNPCGKEPPGPGRPGTGGQQDCGPDRVRDDLKQFLQDLLAGKRVDPCKLRALLESCCKGSGCCDGGDSGGGSTTPGTGGLGDGPGADNWCRFRPFFWLPIEFEYRVVPNPAYAGQFGPLAFEDPWWKVILAILAILLAAASIIYDYIFAGQDPDFVIGTISRKSNRSTSNVDAALVLLNSSRGRDMNVLEAQGDDRNNGLPINGVTGGTVSLDRSDNGDRGIADPTIGNIAFKSGARSATTRGVVASIFNTTVEGNSFTNQVLINPLAAPSNQPVSQGGDSGSLWVDLISRRPIGLNFAGDAADNGVFAIANPIRDVVNLFDIHFNT